MYNILGGGGGGIGYVWRVAVISDCRMTGVLRSNFNHAVSTSNGSNVKVAVDNFKCHLF